MDSPQSPASPALSSPLLRDAPAPMTRAPGLQECEAPAPAFRVVTDAWLLRYINSFQCGIAVELRQIWLRHNPKSPHGPSQHSDIPKLTELVAKFGTLRHLELIKSGRLYEKNQWRVPQFQRLDRIAAENNRADFLQWMLMNGMALSNRQELWWISAQSVQSEDDCAVLALLERVCPLVESDALWLLPDALITPTVPVRRCREQPLRTETSLYLHFLLDHPHSSKLPTEVFIDAHRNGHYDILELLVAKCPKSVTGAEGVLLDATPRVQEIARRYPEAFASARQDEFMSAVRAGSCFKMQALITGGTVDITKPVSVDDAASWEGLAGLEFLHEQGLAKATTEAMDFAPEKNRWDVVEFLHINRSEGCTTRAADAAVKSGNMGPVGHPTPWTPLLRADLHAVRFLHDNRSEGCTTAAIDNAARGGHLTVVKFLCEHRTKGCTLAGIQAALKNHHLDVVQMLYEYYPNLFSSDLLSELLLRGAFEIFMTLRDQFPEAAGRVVGPVMFEAGKQLELRTIRFILNELGRSDLVELMFEGAANLGSGDASKWLQGLHTIAVTPHPEVNTTSSSQRLLHPLLLDTRTSTWVVWMLFNKWDEDTYTQCHFLSTWAVRAIYHRDLDVLQVIRDLPPGTTEPRAGNPFISDSDVSLNRISFEGARAAAVRLGEKEILEWLLTNVDLPIEPTLLSEAVYYHQFELAEWLLEKYPAACSNLDWSKKALGFDSEDYRYGLHGGLLDWLESHDAVRKALPFVGVIDFAARKNDVASLERLYEWYPELFTPRPALVRLADIKECSDTINLLLEIGWEADVFFHGS